MARLAQLLRGANPVRTANAAIVGLPLLRGPMVVAAGAIQTAMVATAVAARAAMAPLLLRGLVLLRGTRLLLELLRLLLVGSRMVMATLVDTIKTPAMARPRWVRLRALLPLLACRPCSPDSLVLAALLRHHLRVTLRRRRLRATSLRLLLLPVPKSST